MTRAEFEVIALFLGGLTVIVPVQMYVLFAARTRKMKYELKLFRRAFATDEKLFDGLTTKKQLEAFIQTATVIKRLHPDPRDQWTGIPEAAMLRFWKWQYKVPEFFASEKISTRKSKRDSTLYSGPGAY